MSDNTAQSLEQAAEAALAALWQRPLKGDLPAEGQLAPGVQLLADPEGEQRISCDISAGHGLRLQVEVARPGAWIGLHIALGDVSLDEQVLVGFYARCLAARACTWRACLRSGTETGFVDHFFGRDVVAYSAPSNHSDVIDLSAQYGLPRSAPWRDFILFFHVESFDLTLQDLRLFSV